MRPKTDSADVVELTSFQAAADQQFVSGYSIERADVQRSTSDDSNERPVSASKRSATETGKEMEIEDSTWSINAVDRSTLSDLVQASSDVVASTSCQNADQSLFEKFETQMINFYHRYSKRILLALKCCACLLSLVYLVVALRHSFGDQDSLLLLAIAVIVVSTKSLRVLKRNKRWIAEVCLREKKEKVFETAEKCSGWIGKHSSTISCLAIALLLLFVVVFVVVDVVYLSSNVYNLVSASGIVVYVGLFWIFSNSRSQVRWLTVFWGFGLQVILALLTLRTSFGLAVFHWFGELISNFLSFSEAGCEFVFGKSYRDHFFAFKITSIIVFFNTFVSVLYYWGVIQYVIKAVAWPLQITMGTAVAESTSAAANIFLSGTETLLMIRPLLPTATVSEIHAIISGGLATVAGASMGVYIELGVPANHLLTASLMSAPAALAMAKIIYPETSRRKKVKLKEISDSEFTSHRNVFEAMSSGASASVKLIAAIMANLIAFVSALHLVNALLIWIGARVGLERLTFEKLCSYLMWPFALIMGVEVADCKQMAMLMGVKIFLNEFIAYQTLGIMIDNGHQLNHHVASNGSWYQDGNDIRLVRFDGNETVLANGVLSERTVAIATYALCGFANFASAGITIGFMSSFIPHRRSDIADCVFTAMVTGHVASFITGCVAGLFYNGG